MQVPAVLLIAIGVAMVAGWLAFAFLLGRRRGRGDLIAPPGDVGGTGARPQTDAPSPTPMPPATPGGPISLPPEVEAEVRALLAQGQKIDAIKRVREVTRSGLKEAMDFVERM